MKKFFLYFIILAAIFLFSLKAEALQWEELRGGHFIVYFTKDKKFAQEVSDASEVYYQRIAEDLGYPRYSEFWLWDKRVKIYIYPSRKSFQKATGQPSWSEGVADYTNKRIASYAWNKGFLESLLPHELAHLIFRDFVGFKGEIPLWLDEGVAQWEEEARRDQIKALAKRYYASNMLLSLKDLMKLDLKNIDTDEKVYIRSVRTKEGERGVLFLSGDNLINTYYLQAASLIGFLIEKYGSINFAIFCRELRDGKRLEQALRAAYPAYIRSLDDLEERWRQYLAEE